MREGKNARKGEEQSEGEVWARVRVRVMMRVTEMDGKGDGDSERDSEVRVVVTVRVIVRGDSQWCIIPFSDPYCQLAFPWESPRSQQLLGGYCTDNQQPEDG